jgi:uncharacterized protein (DUF2235 family)
MGRKGRPVVSFAGSFRLYADRSTGMLLMPKNIVVLCDGTGNELKAEGITNVVRLADLLAKDDPKKQVVFYDPGVGTLGSQGSLTSVGRGATKMLGLGFGYGLRTNVSEGYRFIMDQYVEGDDIFLIGFSRGAYTSRAIAGLINHVGLLPSTSWNLIPYAMKLFWHNMKKDGERVSPVSNDQWDVAKDFSQIFGRLDFPRKRENAIRYVGVWDTVNATGSFSKPVVLPYTDSLQCVQTVRHAVSIDEKRKPYVPQLLELDGTNAQRTADGELKEVWFSGVHSDIGGDRVLSDITLQWIVDGAIEAGLEVDEYRYEPYRQLDESAALSDLGENEGLFWDVLGRKDRDIRPKNAWIHESAILRRAQRVDYRPSQVPSNPSIEPWPRARDAAS